MYYLKIDYSFKEKTKFPLKDTDNYTIGRNENCNIHLPNPDRFISKIHCTLQFFYRVTESYCLVIDGSLISKKKSLNGLWVNGIRVEQHKLKNQDVISFIATSEYPKITFCEESQVIEGDTQAHERE